MPVALNKHTVHASKTNFGGQGYNTICKPYTNGSPLVREPMSPRVRCITDHEPVRFIWVIVTPLDRSRPNDYDVSQSRSVLRINIYQVSPSLHPRCASRSRNSFPPTSPSHADRPEFEPPSLLSPPELVAPTFRPIQRSISLIHTRGIISPGLSSSSSFL